MPGVLIVEAFGQAAAALTAYGVDPKEYENKLVYLMSVEKARFRNPVLPDCELHLDIEAVRSHGRASIAPPSAMACDTTSSNASALRATAMTK